MFNFGTGLNRFDLVTYNSNTVDLSSIYTDLDILFDNDNTFNGSISNLQLLTSSLSVGYSNNSNLIASLSNTGTEGSSNYDFEIALLQNKDISLDADILNLKNKDGFLDSNISSLNSAVSNLSVLSSNSANQPQVNSIATGVSNLSVLSSNYATSNNIMTMTNKSFDFNSNVFTNFPLGSNYDSQILTLQNADTNIMNDISALELKDVNLDLDIGSLNTGYSNQLILISNNASAITSLNSKDTFLDLNIGSLNSGVSNLSVLSSNYATLTGSQTLTNKVIDFNSNSILNLPQSVTSSGGNLYANNIITDPVAGSSTYAHGLGTPPKMIRFEAKACKTSAVGSGSANLTTSFGSYDITGNKTIGTYILSSSIGDGVGYSSSSNCIMLQDGGGNTSVTGTFTGTVTAVDATNITISWALTGSLTNLENRSILWSAQSAGGAGSNDPNAIETFTNKIMSFTANTFNDFPYSIAPTTHLANYIPKWNGTANSKTLVEGVIAPSGNLVGDSATQTLTNKIITDATNNLTANGLRSASTTINISSATAPLSNQVLTATSSTTAIWSTPSTGGGGSSITAVSNPYKFRAVNDLGTTLTTAGTFYTLTYNTENYDLNNNYNNSTYTYTVPVTGYYHLSLQFSKNISTSQIMTVEIAKNGGTILQIIVSVINDQLSHASDILLLTVGDTLIARAKFNAGTSPLVYAGHFTGHLLSV